MLGRRATQALCRISNQKNCSRTLSAYPNFVEGEKRRVRSFSELQNIAGTVDLVADLVESLDGTNIHLVSAASHLFKGGGKYFRPTCVMLMAHACNFSSSKTAAPGLHNQKQIALVAEMIHVASLIHDDVLDEADTRRSLPTVNNWYNDKVAVLSGDYVIARATEKLASIGCSETIRILSNVIRDLIRGEIMQLDSSCSSDVLFEHYLTKTYLKTASLLAHSCHAAALHSTRHPHNLLSPAFEYGRNIGIAFQLVDDMLDFVATSAEMGKDTGADLKLGLATAPVLYASAQHPRLLTLAERRFAHDGDVAEALDMVSNSDGIRRTKDLARTYCHAATKSLFKLPDSHFKDALVMLCDVVLDRFK